jgi:hypothetical protein
VLGAVCKQHVRSLTDATADRYPCSDHPPAEVCSQCEGHLLDLRFVQVQPDLDLPVCNVNCIFVWSGCDSWVDHATRAD